MYKKPIWVSLVVPNMQCNEMQRFIDRAFVFVPFRSLPPELGDLTEMRELTLANNLLRTLPFELGKCFQLTVSYFLLGPNFHF